MPTKPYGARRYEPFLGRVTVCCIVVASFIAAIAVVPASGVMVGGPTIQTVWVRATGGGTGLNITASVRNETAIARVNLSFSPGLDQPLAPPVPMRFLAFDARAGTYNYTYEMDWPYNSIRMVIVAVDANGTAGPPFEGLDTWTSWTTTGTTMSAGGILLAGGLAATVAVGSLGGAILVRRIMRARRP